jgi:hypothetical protein
MDGENEPAPGSRRLNADIGQVRQCARRAKTYHGIAGIWLAVAGGNLTKGMAGRDPVWIFLGIVNLIVGVMLFRSGSLALDRLAQIAHAAVTDRASRTANSDGRRLGDMTLDRPLLP